VTFIEDVRAGRAARYEIDDYIDFWHASNTDMALHDFLGMSEEDYSIWIKTPDHLDEILRRELA
jgi:hypothetical protein